MIAPGTAAQRTVHCLDAVGWLRASGVIEQASFVASLPDISEFSGLSLDGWREWFVSTAQLIFRCTPDNGVTVFYQSDIKLEGTWVDKGYLCQRAAEALGSALLWHKMVCRAPPGQATFGRPGYSHIMCFSKGIRPLLGASTADILPALGDRAWNRGMGLEACVMIAKFISQETPSKMVVNPFCGKGSMLAAANAFGLSAMGIERSQKRAEAAGRLILNTEKLLWEDGNSADSSAAVEEMAIKEKASQGATLEAHSQSLETPDGQDDRQE